MDQYKVRILQRELSWNAKSIAYVGVASLKYFVGAYQTEIHQNFLPQKFPTIRSPLASTLSPFHPHLVHDHLLGPSASLASFNDGLKKLEVLDIPALLYAVYEVLDL